MAEKLFEKLPKNLRIPALIALIALIALVLSLVGNPTPPSATTAGGKQPELTVEQLDARDVEISGLLMKKYGGESSDIAQRDLVNRIATAITTKTDAKDATKPLTFHLLADANAINAFALSTGDVYVTTALVNRMRTEGELAAVMANGAAHVISGHHMHVPEAPAPMIPAFTVQQEGSVDARAVKIMADAGYSPNAMLSMFQILTEAYKAGADTQFFATHPSPEGRLTAISDAIAKLYPSGVPEILSK